MDATLESIDGAITVTGTVEVPWTAECRRCLDEIGGTATVDVSEVFEVHPVEGETYPIEGDDVDLEPVVRDAALLHLPLAPLCREDCAGPAPESFPASVEGDEAADAEPAATRAGPRSTSSASATTEFGYAGGGVADGGSASGGGVDDPADPDEVASRLRLKGAMAASANPTTRKASGRMPRMMLSVATTPIARITMDRHTPKKNPQITPRNGRPFILRPPSARRRRRASRPEEQDPARGPRGQAGCPRRLRRP